jgi:hypothetical protein
VKTIFGNLFTRLLWGGDSLTRLETTVLVRLVETLPPELRSPVIEQIDAYDLVQREVDGRALNFYQKQSRKDARAGWPALAIKPGEVVLLKMAFSIPQLAKPLHATMTAVDGRFFCLNFNKDLRPFADTLDIEVRTVKDSWRSNYTGSAQQSTQAGGPASGRSAA